MSVYADTSAVRRLLIEDAFSEPLEHYLAQESARATCDLTLTELHRVAGWHGLDVELVENLLARFDRVPLTEALFRQAGLLPHLAGTYLRSLDALHIVAALDTSQVAFATYDGQQARAASAVGLRVVSPGRPADWYLL